MAPHHLWASLLPNALGPADLTLPAPSLGQLPPSTPQVGMVQAVPTAPPLSQGAPLGAGPTVAGAGP